MKKNLRRLMIYGKKKIKGVLEIMTVPIAITPSPRVNLPHHRIHEGRYFAVTATAVGLSAGIPKNYLIISPPAAISIAHVITIVTVFPGATFEFFEGTIVSANGTPLPSFNQDRANPAVATGFAFEDPVVVTNGTRIFSQIIGSTTTGGTGGTKERDEEEFDFIPLTNYLLRTTPLSNNTLLSIQMRAYRQATATGT